MTVDLTLSGITVKLISIEELDVLQNEINDALVQIQNELSDISNIITLNEEKIITLSNKLEDLTNQISDISDVIALLDNRITDLEENSNTPTPEPTLQIWASADEFEGWPHFQVMVGGVIFGSLQEVNQPYNGEDWQLFTYTEPLPPGDLVISYHDDKWGGSIEKDRNLYIKEVIFDGESHLLTEATIIRTNGQQITSDMKLQWNCDVIFDRTSNDNPDPGDGGDPTNPDGEDPIPNRPLEPVPQPINENDIVGLQLQNLNTNVQESCIISFGQPFKEGDVPTNFTLIAKYNDIQLPTQVDVFSKHDDGSIRHAMISIEVPEMAPNQVLPIMLTRLELTKAPAINISEVIKNGYDLKLIVNEKTINVADLITNTSLDNVEKWLLGPLATQIRIKENITDDGNLYALFDVRAYKNGSILTDVILAYDWAYSMGMDNITYNVKIINNGNEIINYPELVHHHHGTWHKEVWSDNKPQINVIRDVNYFVNTNTVAHYDPSIVVSNKALNDLLTRLEKSNTNPMGNALVERGMPNTGGRMDIGPMPTWNALYLLSHDPRAEKIMLACADASGSIPWHFRDNATGHHIRVDDHPNLWIDSRGVGGRYGDDQLPAAYNTKNTGWSLDVPHQPALSYIPYVVTGSRYYLDELIAQTTWTMASFLPPPWRGYERCILDASQVRGKAWSLRELSDAAWIVPDSHPLKEYFNKLLNNNVEHFKKKYVDEGYMDDTGELEGWAPGSVKAGHTAPWQTDFLTIEFSKIAMRGDERAKVMCDWFAHFVCGRMLSADKGYKPEWAAPYLLMVFNPETNERYNTWTRVVEETWGSEPTFNTLTPGYPFAYSAILKAALACLVNIGVPEAQEAYSLLMSFNPPYISKYPTDPTWAIVPK